MGDPMQTLRTAAYRGQAKEMTRQQNAVFDALLEFLASQSPLIDQMVAAAAVHKLAGFLLAVAPEALGGMEIARRQAMKFHQLGINEAEKAR